MFPASLNIDLGQVKSAGRARAAHKAKEGGGDQGVKTSC